MNKKILWASVASCVLLAGMVVMHVKSEGHLQSDDMVKNESGHIVIGPENTVSTAITLYQNGRGLIHQTRSATLPKGIENISFGQFPTGLLFSSAVVFGKHIYMQTRQFDTKYEDFSLYEQAQETALGKDVQLLWSVWKDGQLTEIKKKAKLVAVEDKKPVLLIDGYLQKGTDARILYPMADKNVSSKKASLDFTVVSDTDKKQDITLSYLTTGFRWSTTYDVYLDEKGNQLRLNGYVDLKNSTGIDYENVNIDFVLGEVNTEYGHDPHIEKTETRCEINNSDGLKIAQNQMQVNGKTFSVNETASVVGQLTSHVLMDKVGNVLGRGADTTRYDLQDYYVYRLPFQVNLKNDIPVQANFLKKEGISYTKEYDVTFDMNSEVQKAAPSMYLVFENTDKNGLGVPLSEGIFRVFNQKDKEVFFVGESISHTFITMGQQARLNLGKAFDVFVDKVTVSSEVVSDVERKYTYQVTLHNVSDSNRLINITQPLYANYIGNGKAKEYLFDVSSEKPTAQTVKEIRWSVDVPAGSEKSFSYSIIERDLDLIRKKQETELAKQKMVAEEKRLEAEKERLKLQMDASVRH